MKYKLIGCIVCLIVIAVVGFKLVNQYDGFTNLSNLGTFPKSVEQVILDDYKLIGKNETSNNNYNQIWWHYPIFTLGSYEQITNNLQHRYNPDDGTCVRADFCGALYRDKQDIKSNVTTPLPPAEEGPGARVGYFRSVPNELYFSIPTNENIMY
jgi:hypothetical protein